MGDVRTQTAFIAAVLGVITGLAAAVFAAPALALGSALCALTYGLLVVLRPAVIAPVREEGDHPAPAPPAPPTDNRSLEAARTAIAELHALGSTAELVSDDGNPLLDEETGLLNGRYFRAALEERVAAARRHLRPVTIVVLEVSARAPAQGTVDPAMVADVLRQTLRESDSACRLDDGSFGIILEDTPDTSAVWAVERVRRAVAGPDNTASVWAGVASYPTHGLLSAEVLVRCEQALADAKSSTRDRIQVAPTE